ncbi:hypothetical protein AX17_000734 [Amanita inopinata Kibby_2008]|nr:hypothetical protein AX17_000734 [Amanita inopinata Kibby_2008]
MLWLHAAEDWIPFLVPATFLLSAILSHALALVQFPKPLRRLWNPFRNFVTLNDIPGPLEPADGCSTFNSGILTFLAVLSVARWVGYLAFSTLTKDVRDILACLMSTTAWVYIFIRSIMKPYSVPPYLTMLFVSMELSMNVMDISVKIITQPRLDAYALELIEHSISIFLLVSFIWFAGSLPLNPFRPSIVVAKSGDIPSSSLTCPEDDITLWSWSTFSFVEPIFSITSTRTVNEDDVWNLSPFFQHKIIFTKFLEYRSQYPTHSLLRFLLVSNSLDLILDISLEMWSAVVGFVPPYALQQILSALASDAQDSRMKAFKWAFVTFLAHLSFAQVDLYQGWHTRRCYERTRGQLFCSLHYKSLMRRDISGKTDHDGQNANADLGKIVNLMQGDTYAVAQRFWEFSGFFTAPVRLIIALLFLYQILGWSALAGVAVVLTLYVLNYPLAKYNIWVTRSSWKASDKRMSLVDELLQNIRFLKFYGWETRWAERVSDAREAELKWRVKENVVVALISFIWTWIPSATALVTFLCYTLIAGERLTVSKAFTSIALFSQLQGPMMALPGQIFALLHAYVSMERIESFLSEKEVPQWASILTAYIRPVVQDKVGFTGAIFDWELADTQKPSVPLPRFQLGPLDITFPKGKLTLISGATGSGKSALLLALLGEIPCVAGEIFLDKTRHRVAYCGQNPWLEHATIRDNIIYGSSRGFVEERYNAVIEACALNRDLDVFDAGDSTEIGERGVTLSGGQRARIALARALYSEAECILLDDPLAAVDMHTAQHLADNCLRGLLVRDRTIILVTHHIGLCHPIASYFVELEHGRLARQGPTSQDFLDGHLPQNVNTGNHKEVTREEFETVENEADVLRNGKDQVKKRGDGKLIEAEARAKGQVSWRTYYTYIRAAGFYCWLFTLILLVLIRLINIGNQVYLVKWGEAYQEDYPQSIDHSWTDHLPPPDENVRPWLMIYLYISLAGAISVLFYISLGLYAGLQASRSLFNSLLQRLSRAPVRFFDVTPIGRILNRFTTDMNTIDRALQNSARTCLSGVLDFLASFIVILSVVPFFTPFALLIAWLYIRLAPPYIRVSRDLRRLELVSLSPAFAGFDELLRGISHIRAFGMEQRYQNRFYAKVDKFQSFDHVYWLVAGWLRWRYDCLGSLVVFAATMFALWSGVSSGLAAIVIVQAGNFAEASRQLVKVAAQLELDFNSVERVVEYLDVDQEAPSVIEKNRPPAYWPSSTGGLEVRGLTVRYAPHLDPALRDLSFSVGPSEKIGVVGRTGSGKSTLALSLLRMIEPSNGTILLDNIDISTLGLEDLRTRVTIISQDVSLFSGTIRSNLDPLQEHSKEECLDVAERCHLSSVIKYTTEADGSTILDMPVGHDTLSAGEKQLVALGRAMLRRTNVIIMDEATSQIDAQLDDQIQKTIREELASAIVITIAHRLKTIMDYDRILVLDDGQIVEFDKPRVLLAKEGGAFREMCLKSTDWPVFARMMDAL